MAFLVFEGLDGSGKSTLMESFCDWLKTNGLKFVRTREPGGTPLAEDIRHLLLRTGFEVPHPRTEILLYAASRAQHVEQVIRPARTRGDWVISDRFAASTVSFQCFARGVPRGPVDWLNDFAVGDCWPDLNVLVDVPVSVSFSRMQKREQDGQASDRFEQEKADFHQKVRDGFLAQAKADPKKWLVLDGQQSREDLFENLLRELKSRGIGR